MSPIFFCNIGWMSRYEGLKGKPDKIVGGGKWVAKNKKGHEICNFAAADDGYIYGHVETIKGKRDRKIRITSIDPDAEEEVTGVDVVWTATDPDGGGRKIVGWYQGATVFRDRQSFESAPSKQHGLDGINNYRIRVRAKNAHRLDIDERQLQLGRGLGWMGHTPWWTPKVDASPEIKKFVSRVRKLIGNKPRVARRKNTKPTNPNTPGAAASPYSRYVEAYEAEISPRHDKLQKRFEKFVLKAGVTELKPNMKSVDLRYRDESKQLVLAEVKPCDSSNARYAIRTAIGQLLDYRQRCDETARLLVVIERIPSRDDLALALSNGFGLAHPTGAGFKIAWPR